MAPDHRTAAKEWFSKADTDEKSMRILMDKDGPKETICFLAQQWAEKYLKGFLVLNRRSFRFVHDLPYLINLCAQLIRTEGINSVLSFFLADKFRRFLFQSCGARPSTNSGRVSKNILFF